MDEDGVAGRRARGEGCVERRARADDRRRNIVTLTITGRELTERGGHVIDECERRFLAVLNDSGAEQLKTPSSRWS